MIIAVIGIGYVGLVAAACFAEMGNTVTCVDSDAGKVEDLRNGRLPIHEPGLEALVTKGSNEGRLAFTTSIGQACSGADVSFIAVGTPAAADGAADVSQVLRVARELGASLAGYSIIATKSTVPVGTADRIRDIIGGELTRRGLSLEFDIVSNPEFLKEGAAVNDFMRPDRIVLGCDGAKALDLMRRLYAPFVRNHERMLTMRPREAEMTKYAANAMLAARISFMNEIASLCEQLDVDVESVRRGVGADARIGYAFIYPGCGYGGSCLPKDVNALVRMGEQAGVDLAIMKAVEERNARQKRRLFDMVALRFGNDLTGRSFCLWGLSFKPEADDVRQAPSLALIELLLAAGAEVRAFDPIARENAQSALHPRLLQSGRLTFCSDQYGALDQAHALLLVTEWKQFRSPDFRRMRDHLGLPIIFDGRNQYDPGEMAALGFEYYGIGRGARLTQR
jgi:UDPglucose 6-dehydrogenase